jgi:hypothetical protein
MFLIGVFLSTKKWQRLLEFFEQPKFAELQKFKKMNPNKNSFQRMSKSQEHSKRFKINKKFI